MASSRNAGNGARATVPNDPTDLSGSSSWLAAGRRPLKEYEADDLQDRAAALTHFGIQSIFPGLLALVRPAPGGRVPELRTKHDQHQAGAADHSHHLRPDLIFKNHFAMPSPPSPGRP